jgi:transposase
MPKRIDFTLSEQQATELGEAIKHDKRPEVRQRALAIRLLSRQEPPKEVAALMEVSEVTVYKWWHRYAEAGLEGLANQPKGRPRPKADAAYLAALETAIATEPSDLGYDFAIWSVARLREHLAQTTGVHLSRDHLGLLMRRHGYVYRRPKHTLTNLQDAETKQAAQDALDELKKRRQQAIAGSSLWTKPP